eukprot:TRINITY_DN93140_c0_g1_i1.p1 TRINITY_DN93140_c0_g1~~TRINITY_DN93140_c0_g1_i1.p1  ORF type:complete len:172 (+),score=36.65 TRINITY_DN93140_c0_g1_i1:105-620(+)
MKALMTTGTSRAKAKLTSAVQLAEEVDLALEEGDATRPAVQAIDRKGAPLGLPTEQFLTVQISRAPGGGGLGLSLEVLPMPHCKPPSSLAAGFPFPAAGSDVLHVLAARAPRSSGGSSVAEGDLILKVTSFNGLDVRSLHGTAPQMLEWMRAATDIELIVLRQSGSRATGG